MATVDKLIVRIEADLKNLKKGMKGAESASKRTSAKMSRNFAKIRGSVGRVSGAIFSLKGAMLTLGVGAALKSLINVGNEVESLQIRFKTLFGSAEEGAKAFDIMAKFASKVPFSLKQIQAGSGSLLAVADDAEDLGGLLEMTGTIAAATGLDFRSASEQIQRSLSAGIGAADLFRDRGVTAMLGFKAGVKVSVNDTRIALEEFAAANAGITDELAGTFAGTLSMIGDTIFTFQRQINDAGFFSSLTRRFQSLKAVLDGNTEASKKLAKDISDKLIAAMDALINVIDFVRRNWSELIIALKIFIGLKLALMVIPAITGAMGLFAMAVRGATKAVVGLTAASKLNPILFAVGLTIAATTLLLTKTKKAIDDVEESWTRLGRHALKVVRAEYLDLGEKMRNNNRLIEKNSQMMKNASERNIKLAKESNALLIAHNEHLDAQRKILLRRHGPALYGKDADIEYDAEIARKRAKAAQIRINALSDEEKLLLKQDVIVNRILEAELEKMKILKMTKAEEQLYKILKDESVGLTVEQTEAVLATIQATIDLNKELQIQKAILAENASHANEVFKSLSKSSEIEKKDPQKRSKSERTTGLGPLDKFIYPEFKPVGTKEDEAKLLEELGILTKNYKDEFLLLDQNYSRTIQ